MVVPHESGWKRFYSTGLSAIVPVGAAVCDAQALPIVQMNVECRVWVLRLQARQRIGAFVRVCRMMCSPRWTWRQRGDLHPLYPCTDPASICQQVSGARSQGYIEPQRDLIADAQGNVFVTDDYANIIVKLYSYMGSAEISPPSSLLL